MPAALAMVRVLQCVSPFGVVSSVLTITASTASSDTVRGAPTRGSSYKPSRRRSRTPPPRSAVHPLQPTPEDPPPPLAHGGLGCAEPACHGDVRDGVGAREYQARTKRDGTIHVRAFRKALSLSPLAVGDHDLGSGTSDLCHAPL